MSFPCTMNVTSIATMHIVLHLESKTSGRRVNGSPLAFSLRKRCEAATPNIGLYRASVSRKLSENVNLRRDWPQRSNAGSFAGEPAVWSFFPIPVFSCPEFSVKNVADILKTLNFIALNPSILWPANFLCHALDLKLMGDHLYG